MALLMAVQQMRRLGYEHVTFMSDCKNLIDELYEHQAEQTISRKCITEAILIIQDIVEISKPMGFMFRFVNRSMLSSVDVMAKMARKKRARYVITWSF